MEGFGQISFICFRTPSALYPATLYSSEATVYINQTGDKPQKQDTQANKRSPHLSEEVPYQITLIRLRQGSLDRRRREKVIWKMFTENDCYPFTDSVGES